MKNIALICIFVLTSFAGFTGCGGNSSHQFSDQTAFESYIAGALGTDARDVHCTKTSTTTATCQTDLGTINIKCAWADSSGGHDCTYRKQ